MHSISLVDSSMCLCTHLNTSCKMCTPTTWRSELESETEQGIKSANMNLFVINVA